MDTLYQPIPVHARTTTLVFFRPYASTDAYKYSFFVGVIPLWNALPARIAEAPDLEGFKSELSRVPLPPY